MKKNKLTEKQRAVLDRIQNSIPDYLSDTVNKTEKVAPELKKALEKGVDDMEFSEESRKKFKMILDSGYLDKEMTKEDPDISKEIDAYVELEIAKAILRKELPKPKKARYSFEQIYKIYNDIKKKNDKKFKRNS